MHPVISKKDIFEAEKILFKRTNVFDHERIEFIKNLDTVDLQAVPGSGKTTALIAKLIILNKYQPFNDYSGILVISHTNSAVNEIKEKIGVYCPKLFQYPNFIGTIQSYLDQFLAIPYYENKFKKKVVSIDSDHYNELCLQYYNLYSSYGTKKWLSKQRDKDEFLLNIRFDLQLNLINGFGGTPDKFKLKDTSTKTYQSIRNLRLKLLFDGYLHYDDAYLLSNLAIIEHPKIVKILQSRFRYVFVDEMQDMEEHQYLILDNLFFKKQIVRHTFQRIGDQNQSIYSSVVHIENIWNQRKSRFKLSKSKRLSDSIAKKVSPLAIIYEKIIGDNNISNSSCLKPHLIIFDDNTVTNVLPWFAKLIKIFISLNLLPNDLSQKFFAIGWRKDHEDAEKITIKKYYPGFDINIHSKKKIFTCLNDYLIYYDSKDKTLGSVYRNILNSIIHILRLELIKDEQNKYYTSTRLFKYLDEVHNDFYNNLIMKLYSWSFNLIKHGSNAVQNDIQAFLSELVISVFNHPAISENTHNFFNHLNNCNLVPHANEVINKLLFDGIEINISTIHSVKGTTNCATLYLETFYESKYESERMINQIKGIEFCDSKVYHKQTAKMMYVGFSRPTHLLCFAVHGDHVADHLEDISKNNWEIVDIRN
ncbi:MAG: UvrD-helicase domain-containing protein [Ignavibacteriaceae bacterium]